MVVLNERQRIASSSVEGRFVEAFQEKAAFVTENTGLGHFLVKTKTL